MSKTETLRQSAAALSATRVAQLASQVETLRQTKHQSAEELAATLEPLAQALATLTDETRDTLAEIETRTRQQGETFDRQMTTSAQSWKDAAAQAQKAADRLNRAGSRLEWIHYALAVVTALATAALVSAFWLWRAPPTVQNTLDPKAVAEYLKPAIEALKLSRGR